ncbi:MAG: YHS domain-containing protein [Planctomycetes bacterium]|nr:YHS domain-containing protein [Planctomycetota bacterium]
MLEAALVAMLVTTFVAGNTVQAQDAKAESLGLEGYCPVCLIETKKWVRGNPDHQVTYDGKTYYFPSESEKRMFEEDPSKYVPALGGDCTVCFANAGKRVPGNIRHGALYKGRVFLFTSDREKKEFLSNTTKYADADLALGGRCVVCRVMAGKDVPGRPEFTAIHQGLRYQFVSERERRIFAANPTKFVGVATSNAQASARDGSNNVVTIKGKSACAGCEHGVAPIGAPDELGLAVNAPDGRVYVVEDAHKKYPRIYERRYDGLPLELSGTVLKTDGNITWIKPQTLRVLK